MRGRCVEGFGELLGEVVVVDCFLEWVGDAAGGALGAGVLRLFVCGEFLRAKPFGRWSDDAHEREKDREAGEEARQGLDSTNLTTSGVGVCRSRRSITQPGGVG
jgi:hypothetical protein